MLFISSRLLGYRALSTAKRNPLTPNDFQRRRSVNPLKIKIPTKNMPEKPTNATIINLVY
jgi:hypothetical protein